MNHFFIFLLPWMILTSEGTKTRRIFSVENKKKKRPFWHLNKLFQQRKNLIKLLLIQ